MSTLRCSHCGLTMSIDRLDPSLLCPRCELRGEGRRRMVATGDLSALDPSPVWQTPRRGLQRVIDAARNFDPPPGA